MELGKSKEDYLKTIFVLQRKLGNVHSVNIARIYGGFQSKCLCSNKTAKRAGVSDKAPGLQFVSYRERSISSTKSI